MGSQVLALVIIHNRIVNIILHLNSVESFALTGVTTIK